MKPVLMGLMLMALSIGMAQAAQPERPRQAQTAQAAPEPALTRGVPLKTSPERKAEAVRRMFWLALSLRSGGG